MMRLGGPGIALWLVIGGLMLAACGGGDENPPPTGPTVTFFGMARADDTRIDASGTKDGLPLYTRTIGSGFRFVVEGKPGVSGKPVGMSSYQEDLTNFPDLQVEVSQPLGNGSAAVCDGYRATSGGVPATDPLSFDPTQRNVNASNDLACHFRDGEGNPRSREASDASCVKMLPTEEYSFVESDSTAQFCGFITGAVAFPPGDTVVTVRLRDVDGNPGEPAQLVIRVSS